MASEIRNNFVQSKMNKDLDDRLLQPGEYREASNVNISRSEGEDVGALENVLGNDLLSNFNLSNTRLEIIGYISDETNNRAFFMATDYTDSSEDGLNNVATTFTSHYVLMFDFRSNTPKILVQGSFLNFSKRSNIYGINIVEDLLFWTDNRNQPRKINIDKAIENPNYYKQEETISVAKYYPYNAPYIYDDIIVNYLKCEQTNLKPTTPSSVDAINNTPVTDIFVNEANFNKVKVSHIYKRTKQDFDLCERIDIPPGVDPGFQANQNDRYGGSVFWIKEKISAATSVEIYDNIKGEGYVAGDAYPVLGGNIGLGDVGAGLSIQVLTVDGVGGITSLQVYDTISSAHIETGGNGYSVGEVYPVTAPFGGVAARIEITAVEYRLRLNGLANRSLPTTQDPGSVRFTYPTATNKSEKWLPVTCIGQVVKSDSSFAYHQFIDDFVTSTYGKLFMLQNIKGKWPELGMKLTCPGKDNPWDSNGGIDNPEYIITHVIRVKSVQNGGTTRQCANNPFQYQYDSTTCQEGEINDGSLSGTCLLRVSYAPYDDDSPANPLITAGNYIQLQSPNPHYNSEWPGDESFLEDKFVRFAYRFKFDDGEYSLISPFTQPVFIPKQNGYFLDYVDEADTTTIRKQEDDVGAKTIIPFMENKVNNVGVNIEMPTIVSDLESKYKITEIDILYKESDSLNIMLVQSIPTDSNEVTNNNTNILKYDYQSKKPFKLLPEREITRVSDKVPVRAFTQSIVGNRVVYGNFLDKHSPPDGLDYNVGISAKYTLDQNLGCEFPSYNIKSVPPFNPTFSIISYPNHSLKQNRTYQVGVVLSDKYGRQSDVILSKDEESSFALPVGNFIGNFFAPNTSTTRFGGSTAYSKYNDFFPAYPSPIWGVGRIGENGGWVYRDGLWNGDSLKVLFREKIPSTQTGEFKKGYPGLYKPSTTYLQVSSNVISDNEITFTSNPQNVKDGDICFVDSTWCVVTSVDVSGYKVELNQNVTVNALTQITFYGTANELGWYTYKIVVKQTEQDYYNAYLPNVSLASEISALVNTQENFGLSDNGGTYYTSLISDNINKIASDVTKVQPEQTQFSTSDDILYPRVGYNSTLPNVIKDGPYSSGFFQAQQSLQVNGIGKLEDLGLQSVKLNGVKLGRVQGVVCAGGTCTAEEGRVVYNLVTTTNGDGVGCRVKVGVTNAGTLPNYVVVTNPGRDYKNGDTITVPARSSLSPGYVEGQATWNSFNFVLSTSTSPFGVDEPFGEDIEPRQSPGLFNASSNPNVAVLFNNANLPIGQDSSSRTNVFSAFEIKPLNSNLDIYWETSTSGLISELNEAIEDNVDAQKLT
tara:strand:- start:2498 stop:6472 length:3975 start_codon:yes stop_codon:yes gene_type:complete